MAVMTRPGPSLPTLFDRALRSGDTGIADDPADARLYEAVLTALGRYGSRAITMAAVATASGVSRATLFRRFGSKDTMLERAIAYALDRMQTEVSAIFTSVDDPADRIVETFVGCVRFANLLVPPNAGPERRAELLGLLTKGEPSPVQIAARFVADHIATAQEEGRIPAADPQMQAGALIRITIGYLITTGMPEDLTDPETTRRIARTVIAPIITSPGAAE